MPQTIGLDLSRKRVVIAQCPLLSMIVFGFVLLATANQKVSYQIPFCELPSANATFNQPVNTWSTLGFILVALVISTHATLHFGLPSLPQRMFRQVLLPVGFSWSIGMVGFGSIAFHGLGVNWGGEWDVASTFIFYSLVLAMSTSLLLNWQESELAFALIWLAYSTSTIALGFFILPHGGLMGISVFCPILNAILNTLLLYLPSTAARRPREQYWFWLSQASLLLALLIWGLSHNETSPLCDPGSLVQGHAIWHVFCAVTCALLYAYHCSEPALEYHLESGTAKIMPSLADLL